MSRSICNLYARLTRVVSLDTDKQAMIFSVTGTSSSRSEAHVRLLLAEMHNCTLQERESPGICFARFYGRESHLRQLGCVADGHYLSQRRFGFIG